MYTSTSQKLQVLLGSKRTVFTLDDLSSIWIEKDKRNTIITARRMVHNGLIIKLGKGYYSINKDYNRYELANIIISPSYISLHSALFYWNVAFQKEETIQSVALLNYEKVLDETIYRYHAMKKELFFDIRGIVLRDNISFATPERAFLDTLYFNFLANIDNKEPLNPHLIGELAVLYPKSTQKKAKEFLGAL